MTMKQELEAYLQGKLTQVDREKLIESISLSDEIDFRFRQNIEGTQDTLSPADKQRIWKNISPSLTKQKGSARPCSIFWHTMAASITILLLLAAAWSGYWWHGQQNSNRTGKQIVKIQTGVGERSQATLPDGTVVSLNALTSVSYDCSMTDGQRNVYIEGEAYFDVAKDADHPFVINVNQMEVTCLGTELNIRNYADEQTSSVVLVDGKVRVATECGDLTMEPDSRVECDKESMHLSKTNVVASNYTCWLNGETRYNNQTLADISRELARNYHINIVITNDELREQRFTGFLGSCSLRNVLDILTITSDMAYQIDGDSVYIYARNTKN